MIGFASVVSAGAVIALFAAFIVALFESRANNVGAGRAVFYAVFYAAYLAGLVALLRAGLARGTGAAVAAAAMSVFVAVPIGGYLLASGIV